MKPEDYPEQPSHLWEHFYQISQIPRPSRQEEAVRQYVIDQAEQRHCPWRMDKVGNIVVSVPATPGREERPTVIIQNHLDMVTVKADDKEHDFSLQPLSLQVDGGWLRADRTTLGADNGVGCAAALALLSDEAVEHPPLELLFTVDEETGLGGALNLDPALLRGDLMLNLDTEEWNELYVGCAGGGGWELRCDYPLEPLPAGFEQWCVTLRGLAGGHSGIQIHEQLGNAIKLLVLVSGVLIYIDNLGIDITTVLAGLGVGGIAVALALQKPMEDVLGAITLYAQQPIKVGDFCRIGDTLGTIESIGLRTTRIRTLQNTLIAAPNARVAGEPIDNISARKRILYWPTLRLRYDASLEQIQEVLDGIRDFLESHDRVYKENYRVRFKEIAEDAFLIEIFVNLETKVWTEYLELVEELNLEFLKIVDRAGTSLALPAQTMHIEGSNELTAA